jgi:DNA-binding transcriptional LysR family regulator
MALQYTGTRNGNSRVKRIVSKVENAFRASSRLDASTTRQLGMTLNQFALFVAAAKYLSITKAAKELRVSQPSVSQQLKQLEDRYGAKLYRRLSKGIEITEAGQLFLGNITPILVQVAKLGDDLKPPSSPKLVPAILTVGGTFSASAVLLPTLLARLQLRHPGAQLELRTGTSVQLERLVLSSTLDLAVTERSPLSNDLSFDPLGREKVVVFVPLDHLLARRKFVALSDVLAEPLIIRGGKGISGTTEHALKRLRDQGLELKIGMRCGGPSAIKAAVRQKMGVGLAFEDSVRAEIESGEFKALKVRGLEIETRTFVIYPKNRSLSSMAQKFLELLRGARAAQKLDNASKSSRRSIDGLRSSHSGYSQVSRNI